MDIRWKKEKLVWELTDLHTSGSIDTTFRFEENLLSLKKSVNKDSLRYQASKHEFKGFEYEILESLQENHQFIFFKEYRNYGRLRLLNITGGTKAGYLILFGEDGMIEKITMFDTYSNGKTVSINSIGEKSIVVYRLNMPIRDYFKSYLKALTVAFTIAILYHIFFFINRKKRKENMTCPHCGKVQRVSFFSYFKILFKRGRCKRCKEGLRITFTPARFIMKLFGVYPLLLPIIYITYLTQTEMNMPVEIFPELYSFIIVLVCLYVSVIKQYSVIFGKLEKKK